VARNKSDKKKSRKPQKRQNVIQRYINETIGELRKVTWPTRREATNLTIVVIIVVVVMSAYLGVLDFIFNQLFRLMLG
jgi:preprotein translocase subunit SecE